MNSPKVPSAAEEAAAQMSLERERARIDAEKQAAADKKAAEEKAAKIATAKAKQNAAYQTASGYDDKQAGYRGYDQGLLDKYNVSNIYQDAIDATRGTFGETDDAPVFGESNAYNNAVQTGTNTYRNDLRKAIDQYAGTDFANQTFGSTADDAFLEAILGSQRNDATAQIDAAHQRGTLSDAGYSKALEKLNNANTVGMSNLQKIGGGVLSTNRKTLDDYATNIRNQAAGATFDNPFDTNRGQQGLADLTKQLQGSLEGDVRGAVGETSFFDPTAIIGYGTTQQGYYNPSAKAPVGDAANPLLQSFTDDSTKKNSLTSGASTGAF